VSERRRAAAGLTVILALAAVVAACSDTGHVSPATYRGTSEPGRQDYAPPYIWSAPRRGPGGG
jgi:hypothetical protein